jgi:hypothetical protein
MKIIIANILMIALFIVVISCSSTNNENKTPKEIKLTKSMLVDKIKGGWAGQVIGCTFGGPTEFKFKGSMINDYHPCSFGYAWKFAVAGADLQSAPFNQGFIIPYNINS